MHTERRKEITDLDTPEVKLAREHIELLGKMAEGDLVEKLLQRQDQLVEAVLKMREIAEHVLVSPTQTYHLSQALLVANKVLQDAISDDGEVEEKTIYINDVEPIEFNDDIELVKVEDFHSSDAEEVTDDDVP